MWIPGFGAEELRPYKKASTTEAHKQVSSPRVGRFFLLLVNFCDIISSF